MKIVMMTNTFTPIVGGVERSILSFTSQIRQKGHEVMIVAPTFKDQPKDEQDVIRLPALQKFNKTDFSVNLPVPGILNDFFNDYEPDIIHSHHPFLVGDLALRLSSQYSIPIVFTYHTMFEDYVHYLPIHNKRVKQFVMELTAGYANMMDRVVVPSESVQKILVQRDVKTEITVIPTGIDVKWYARGNGMAARQKFGLPKNAYVVGHVGRLAKEKNLDFLTRSVGQFLAEEKNSCFFIVGSGPEKDYVQNTFESLGLGERVRFAGVLKGEDLVNAYHAMDVFAFSSHSETQGVVLTEAMASGVPVVAVDASGVREVVKDRTNGRLIDNDDQKDYVSALRWCKNIWQKKDSRLNKSAVTTAKRFSKGICAQKLLDTYEDVLSDELVSKQERNVWHSIMNRIQTEWEMLKNLTEAGEAALAEKEKK